MAVIGFGTKYYRVIAQALLTFGIGISGSWLFPGRAEASQIQTLGGHVPSAVAGLHAIGELQKSQRLDLVIGLPLRNQPALTALLQRLYDPASPDFHKFLTPAQFTEQFGPTES